MRSLHQILFYSGFRKLGLDPLFKHDKKINIKDDQWKKGGKEK